MRLVLISAVCLLVTAGAIAGFVFSKPWRVARLSREAREALLSGDLSVASLKARRALQLDTEALAPCVVLAELAESAGDPTAVMFRERVVELSPDSADALILCARSALTFGKPAVANRVLAKVQPADRDRADYHAAAGELALKNENFAAAERHFASAVRCEPSVDLHRFHLGQAQLGSPDYLTRESGRQLLIELTEKSEFRIPAGRALVASYEATAEPIAALRACEKLVEAPEHAFDDELTHLHLLRITEDPRLASALAQAQAFAAPHARDAGALLLWMSQEELAAEAVEWAKHRNPQVARMADVQPALAGCHLVLRDWPALLAVTRRGPWQVVEFARHAYRARALQETGGSSAARLEWEQAIAAAGRQAEAHKWLAQVAIKWGWQDEAERSLWALLDEAPGTRWALDRLQDKYLREHHTLGLRRVAAHVVQAEPENESALNDFAMSSLLLGRELERALRISEELHWKHPENAAFASTYAFALNCAKQPAAALKVFEKLPPEALENPAIAVYYGIVLAANKAPEKARHFLEIGTQATLLEEERALLTRAAKVAQIPGP